MQLVPLPVALPLAVAALLLALAHVVPERLPDIVATLTALAVAAICGVLAVHAALHGELVYWFGGWTPRPEAVLGIAFGVDLASACIGSFIGLLFAAALLFAWGYFDEVHAHFQVLMLLFLAAMEGFSLTRDLFNLFVWFEVMSVVAFALTAYQLEMPSLAGALNFTVTNSLASFMMLGGIGLLYARAGALDFEAVGQAVTAHGSDAVAIGGFCLLCAALMIKAAILPFHFWLSDAHAVAPSPVCVIFSGAMVSVGLFALAKVFLQIFGGSAEAHFLIRNLFLSLGAATAVVGGLMARAQRHLKRMLAFSTIAHLGIMLTGLAAMSSAGLTGLLVYFVGHGLVKGALFMVAGILLALRGSVDELELYGEGSGLAPAGIAMALGGLLLGGLPWGVMDAGSRFVSDAGAAVAGPGTEAALMAGAVLTGATVLRAAGTVFLGLGAEPDPEEVGSPSAEEQEKANRPLWLMMIPCGLLLALALIPGDVAAKIGIDAAQTFGGASPAGPRPALPSALLSWISTAVTVGLASYDLLRHRLPEAMAQAISVVSRAPVHALTKLHTGLVSDYVIWIAVGLGCFSVVLAFG